MSKETLRTHWVGCAESGSDHYECAKMALKEARAVIEFYGKENNWVKQETEVGDLSMMDHDSRGEKAREWLEKWKDKL